WNRVRCKMSPYECMIGRRIEALVWDGSQFLAIGNSGTDRVYRITGDGLRIAGDCPGGFYRDIEFNGSTYVTVGDHSFAWSSDGEHWFPSWNPEVDCPCFTERSKLRSLAWTGSQWVAVGSVPCGAVVLTGPDGASWDLQLIEGPALESVAWSGERLVAVGDVSLTSLDGTSWSVVPSLPAGMKAVTWTGTEWLAVGSAGRIFSSVDGISWAQVGAVGGCPDALAAGGGAAVAVGYHSMAWFDDHSGWVDLLRPAPEAAAVLWDGDRFVAVGPTRVHGSGDGKAWRRLECGMPHSVVDAVWDGHGYLAVGFKWVGTGWTVPSAQYSADGATWSEVVLPAEASADDEHGFRAVAWSGSLFVAVADTMVLTSEDAVSWQVVEPGPDAVDLVWDGSRFVALGSSGALVSDDGEHWAGPYEVWGPSTPDLLGHEPRLAAGDGLLVAVAPDGTLAASADVVSWAACDVDVDSPVADVVWTGSDWVAVTLDEQVLTSVDGLVWSRQQVPWEPAIPSGTDRVPNRFRLASGGGRVVAVSQDLALVRDCVPPPPRHGGGRVR
ncbi:MAG TPA: hypothetical protein VLT32_03680, partial [Candidatus Sulfomarinibacteraceae bacterium]|nr:hypothetical protein [Candidatus Sulfomarinibacteraceae bacterium]